MKTLACTFVQQLCENCMKASLCSVEDTVSALDAGHHCLGHWVAWGATSEVTVIQGRLYSRDGAMNLGSAPKGLLV